MIEITSVNNDLVKETVKLQQKKYRNEKGLFLLEGYKCIFEAVNFGLKIAKIFVSKEKLNEYNFVKSEIISTNQAVLKKISTTDSAPEAVAVAYQLKNNVNNLANSKRVVLLENISDAGNLGTIIRTAAAFKIDSIVLYGGTVDIYNPKCVRSTVGNLWKVNIVHIDSIKELEKYFNDFERVATLPKTNNSVWFNDWKPKTKVLMMFGAESSGLSDELKDFANQNLTIEMNKDVESLNLSISAGIVMHKML